MEEDADKIIKEDKQFNIRIFPSYKMLSWDLLFYYSIIFLYLTQVKHLSAAQVILGETLYNVVLLVFQLPAGKIVDTIGKKHAVIIANVSIAIASVILIFMHNYTELMIAYIFQGFGFAIKGIAEENILYNSLPNVMERGKMFSKIDGKGASRYYYLDAISGFLTGFLYALNPYIPMILCLTINIISIMLSVQFNHTDTEVKIDEENGKPEKLREVFKHVFKSKRLLSLVSFYVVCAALFYLTTSLRSSLFEDLALKPEYFGIIYGISFLLSGIFARFSNTIHNIFKNKTLTVIGFFLAISFVTIGTLGNIAKDSNGAVFNAIVLIFIMQGALRGSFKTLIARYMSNFTNSQVRTKLKSVENFLYNIVVIILGLITSAYLSISNTSNTFIVVGGIAFIIIVLIIDYMKTRVGLKPEEYTQEDLKYDSFKNGKEV